MVILKDMTVYGYTLNFELVISSCRFGTEENTELCSNPMRWVTQSFFVIVASIPFTRAV